jgi:hypothetical protein
MDASAAAPLMAGMLDFIIITFTGKACKAHRRRKAARVLKPLKKSWL